jgi:protein required for attachment to host cells
MRRTWVLVCDSSIARLLQVEPEPRDWILIDELHHRESRLSGQDLGRDSSEGEIQQNEVTYRNALEPLSLKKVEAERFAKQLASVLHEAVSANSVEDLILVAPPAFLGLLRKNLTTQVERRVRETLNKDYAHLKPAEIAEQLSG